MLERAREASAPQCHEMTTSRRTPLRAGVVFAAAIALATLPVRAAGPLSADGSPIRTSRYGVDLMQTPVLAGARVTGLAGAYVAIAEGTDGNIQTPVAPAVRTAYSFDHFDYELSLGVTLPATLTSTDFFNTGRGRTQLSDANQKGFVFVTPALNLVWGRFGIGATAELQTYSLARSNDAPATARLDQLSAQFAVVHVQAAAQFGGGQLAVGGGVRILNLDVTNQGTIVGDRALFSTLGAGVELGALYMPRGKPFRVGAAFRSAVSTTPDSQSQFAPNGAGDRVVGDPADAVNAFWLPDRVEQPWDLNMGLAVQIGPRPFNVPFRDPKALVDDAAREIQPRATERAERRQRFLRELHADAPDSVARQAVDAELDGETALDELHVERVARDFRTLLKLRHARLPRRYVLVSMSLVLTGATKDAVGVESFLQRVVARSGDHLVYSPRLGMETEVVPYWVKVRAGTYGEPSRFATSGNRLHGTFGFDAKLFPWRVFGLFEDGTEWRLGASLDAAPRYFGWGVGVGVWH
jgi:hypothetical protein